MELPRTIPGLASENSPQPTPESPIWALPQSLPRKFLRCPHVVLRGTCLRAKYRKQDAPWLAPEEYREDPEATITLSQLRALAWEVANEAARQLGWIRSCNDLHEAAKLAGTAI
jgi:hypothetical protein